LLCGLDWQSGRATGQNHFFFSFWVKCRFQMLAKRLADQFAESHPSRWCRCGESRKKSREMSRAWLCLLLICLALGCQLKQAAGQVQSESQDQGSPQSEANPLLKQSQNTFIQWVLSLLPQRPGSSDSENATLATLSSSSTMPEVASTTSFVLMKEC